MFYIFKAKAKFPSDKIESLKKSGMCIKANEILMNLISENLEEK